MLYRYAADFVLLLHTAIVIFTVAGFALIVAGKFRNWKWVRNFWFRTIHLLIMGIVVVQAWLGKLCPLTTLEMGLRARAGDSTYHKTFIAHWLQTLLYWDAPMWVFTLLYSVFCALVIGSWFWVRPERKSRGMNRRA